MFFSLSYNFELMDVEIEQKISVGAIAKCILTANYEWNFLVEHLKYSFFFRKYHLILFLIRLKDMNSCTLKAQNVRQKKSKYFSFTNATCVVCALLRCERFSIFDTENKKCWYEFQFSKGNFFTRKIAYIWYSSCTNLLRFFIVSKRKKK